MDHKNLVLAERDLLPAGGVGYAFDIVVFILTLNFGMGGSARAKLHDEVVELKPWDAIRVPAEAMRVFEARPEEAEYTAFGAPNIENRDAESAPNWWTD